MKIIPDEVIDKMHNLYYSIYKDEIYFYLRIYLTI